MNGVHRRRLLGVALNQMVAATAALTLMATVVPPSLRAMRRQMRPVSCANNLRVCNQAFNVYGAAFAGTWIAAWETHLPPGQWNVQVYQWPYTMVHYVTGGHIADGKAVYWYPGGWWNPEGYRGDCGSFPLCSSPEDAPQLQCAELVERGREENSSFYGATSYSYALMDRFDPLTQQYRTDWSYYPVPDFMTHPATTIHLHDLGGIANEQRHNIWSKVEGFPSDPHDGKSNYVFCDGHVELLSVEQTTPRMWQDQWRAADDAAVEAARAGGEQ